MGRQKTIKFDTNKPYLPTSTGMLYQPLIKHSTRFANLSKAMAPKTTSIAFLHYITRAEIFTSNLENSGVGSQAPMLPSFKKN
jgi:hypothetical protein